MDKENKKNQFDKRLNYRKKLTALALIFILSPAVFTACGSSGSSTKVIFTTGFGDDEVFRIANVSCTTAEIMVYLTTTQNQYESVYGSEVWNVALGDVTLEENVKETDRKSTRLNSSHCRISRMPSSA